MADNPTGLRHSSPIVCRRYVVISHPALTRPPPAANWAAGIRIANPAARKNRPRANLLGVDGSRLPSLSHSHANAGASRMIQSELTDWNHASGKVIPRNECLVLSLANSVSVEPACSNADQNTAA